MASWSGRKTMTLTDLNLFVAWISQDQHIRYQLYVDHSHVNNSKALIWAEFYSKISAEPMDNIQSNHFLSITFKSHTWTSWPGSGAKLAGTIGTEQHRGTCSSERVSHVVLLTKIGCRERRDHSQMQDGNLQLSTGHLVWDEDIFFHFFPFFLHIYICPPPSHKHRINKCQRENT